MINRISSRDAARLLAGISAIYKAADDSGLLRPQGTSARPAGQGVPGADRAGTDASFGRSGGKLRDIDFGQTFENVWGGILGAGRRPEGAADVPHNIIVSEDAVLIEIAVAGYGADAVSVTAIDPTDGKPGAIVVEGKARKDDRKFAKREVGGRDLHCVFDLPQGYKVAAADCKDGLLSVSCERIADKPAGRKIDIGAGK